MIDDFRFDYRWLSNFHLVDICYEGIHYPSSEHAYQAAKFPSLEMKAKFSSVGNLLPKEAKRLGSSSPGKREDWDFVRLEVMESILRLKFTPGSTLAQQLVETYPQELIEGNWWNDCFWGVCKGVGENNLGKILMKIRHELVQGQETTL